MAWLARITSSAGSNGTRRISVAPRPMALSAPCMPWLRTRTSTGFFNKTISEELRIGEQAVKGHISRLFLKFRVESRAGLAVAAMSQEIDRRSLAARELERLAVEEHQAALRARAMLLG